MSPSGGNATPSPARRRGVPAPADLLAHYADAKVIASYHRGRLMNRVQAIRRVQLREYFKKAA